MGWETYRKEKVIHPIHFFRKGWSGDIFPQWKMMGDVRALQHLLVKKAKGKSRMKAPPHIFQYASKMNGRSLERIDPREKMYDEKWSLFRHHGRIHQCQTPGPPTAVQSPRLRSITR